YETALNDDLFTRPELIQSPEFRPVHDAPLVSERVIEDGTPVAPKPRRRRVATRRRSWLAGAFKKVAGLLGRTSTSEKKWHKDLVALAEELEPVAQIDPATASRDLHEELKTDSNLLGDLAKMETGATKTLDADGRLIETARTISTQAPLRERLRHRVRRLGTHVKETLQALFLVGQRKHALETGPKGAAWWRRTLIEIGTLYAIIIPIEITVSQGHVGSYGVHPHPYWLVVLPMAGARGVVAALVAATIGAILYVVGVIQALGTIPTSQLFTLKTMLEPLLFFGSGFFLGELHDELAARHKRVKRRLKEAEEQYSSVRQEREVLSEANKILETRIVDHSAQFGNVIVAAERIERSGRSEIFEVALDLVEEHCGASASALLLLGDGSIDYICHRGWPDEERGERLGHARRSSLVHRAIKEGTAINGFAGDNAPTQGPLVAAPLFDDKGVVKALLCLDEIPASRLNESTINTFLGICDWICSAMVRLSRDGQPTDTRATFQSQPQDELRLGAVEELGSRLRLEYERCARYGVPTSILALHAIEWTDTSREGDAAIDRYMLSHFTGGMRPGDGLYRFGYPGCYVVVLAGTPLEGAEVVRGRLLRRIEYSPVSTAGRVEIYATGPDVEAPDLMTLIERIARQFRRSSPLPLDATCPVPIPGFAPVGNLDAFLRRLRLETSLAARNSFDLHVVGIAATNQEAADGELLAGHIDQIGESVLRPSDGAYRIGPNQCAIILPNTDAEASALVVHRIVTTLRERDPDAPYGDLETQVLGLGPSYPNASSFLSALARAKPTESTGFGAKGGDK
ncbi:MAG: hypothetical protein O7E54_13235, partial [Planctomycetota bacterium]|nr:hypothetical protein [Planctomycetota bacterium]